MSHPTPYGNPHPSPHAGHGRGRHRSSVLVMLALALQSGCGFTPASDPTPPFLPSWQEARQALESVLTAWHQAKSPVPDSFDTDTIRFVDKQRRPGQRLEKFEILNRIPVDGARQFSVRMVLDGDDAPILVRYNVLGLQPIWVFRLGDLEMFSHWEHDMTESKTPPDAKSPPPANPPAPNPRSR